MRALARILIFFFFLTPAHGMQIDYDLPIELQDAYIVVFLAEDGVDQHDVVNSGQIFGDNYAGFHFDAILAIQQFGEATKEIYAMTEEKKHKLLEEIENPSIDKSYSLCLSLREDHLIDKKLAYDCIPTALLRDFRASYSFPLTTNNLEQVEFHVNLLSSL